MKNKPEIYEFKHPEVMSSGVYSEFKTRSNNSGKNIKLLIVIIFCSIAIFNILGKMEGSLYGIINTGKKYDEIPKESLDIKIKEITLEDAYSYLNGKKLDFYGSNVMSIDEEEYLKKIFSLVNEGILERARHLMWHNNYYDGAAYIDHRHDKIIQRIYDIIPPAKLSRFHSYILNGFQKQKEFFVDWSYEPERKFNVRNKLVQESHNNIYNAYLNLIGLYKVNSSNKNIFFQHLYTLCLD